MNKTPADSAKPLHEACAPLDAFLCQLIEEEKENTYVIDQGLDFLERVIAEYLPVESRICWMEDGSFLHGKVVEHSGESILVLEERKSLTQYIHWEQVLRVQKPFKSTMPKEKEE